MSLCTTRERYDIKRARRNDDIMTTNNTTMIDATTIDIFCAMIDTIDHVYDDTHMSIVDVTTYNTRNDDNDDNDDDMFRDMLLSCM